MMSKILITGGNGFVGKAICEKLKTHNYILNITSRNNLSQQASGLNVYNVGEIDQKNNWLDALDGVNCVIHCAGKTHVINGSIDNSLFSFRKVNVDGTINLARQAVSCGVKRFIFLSSIKVNGESTEISSMFNYDDIPKPEDSYGISKWEAEKELWKISKQTGLEVIVIRAPLVYGPKVKGNLKRLINLIHLGAPLPFSLIKNKRSMIGIDNLVDVIIRCIFHPTAAKKTFLVSDEEDLSTPDLIKHIAFSMKRSAILFPLPISLLKFFGFILGKKNEINKLIGSLKVDISYTKEILNWEPSLCVKDGIKKMIDYK